MFGFKHELFDCMNESKLQVLTANITETTQVTITIQCIAENKQNLLTKNCFTMNA